MLMLEEPGFHESWTQDGIMKNSWFQRELGLEIKVSCDESFIGSKYAFPNVKFGFGWIMGIMFSWSDWYIHGKSICESWVLFESRIVSSCSQ